MSSRQEKIAYILSAVESGVAASKIEPVRKGATISRLKKDAEDSEVGDKKVDEMYEKAKEQRA
jgi:hypothetical protein